MNKCNRCEKEFKSRYDYQRHLNRVFPCKDNNTPENNYLKVIDELKIKNEVLKIENEKLKQETEKLKQEIEKFKNENKQNNDKNIINNVNNINNEINVVNNNINNGNVTINNNKINIIKIVNHGEEDYTKINMNEILQKIEKPPEFERVSSVIYYIHCNDDFPEYQNIYITDLSRGKMKIYSNGEWKNSETKPVIESLYNKIIEHYDETDDDNKNVFSFIKKEAKKTYPIGANYTKKNRTTGVNNAINVLYDNRERIKAIKVEKIKKKDLEKIK